MIVGHIGAAAAAAGYLISKSLRFRAAASAYLTRTNGGSGNSRTMTFSFWIKRGQLGASQYRIVGSYVATPNDFAVYFEGDQLKVYNYSPAVSIATTALLRDPSAWYHVVVAIDTTSATAASRVVIYVNGVQAALSATTYPAQNDVLYFNNTNPMDIGRSSGGGTYFDGYLADFYFIDGQALGPTSFGSTEPTTGQWLPKQYSGTYGTRGYRLDFSDATSTATITADRSGNGNNWTANNISLTAGATYDSMVDTPTNNYATLNPVDSSLIMTEGNLRAAHSAASYVTARGTVGMSTGKWVWEVYINTGAAIICLGIANGATRPAGAAAANAWMYDYDGAKYLNGAGPTAYGATYTTGDLLRFEFDADARSMVVFKNNVSQGTLFTGIAADTYYPWVALYNSMAVSFNFGQRPFTNTPTTGYLPLCTSNLPEPSIKKPNQHFDILTWVGDGTASRTLSGLPFAPGLVWNKGRSGTISHVLFDIVRGAGANSELQSDSAGAEGASNVDQFGYVSAFTASGFSVTQGSGGWAYLNANSATQVAWNWKAGSTVTNTDGSISSQVSANPTAGFSIVTYTGTGANATVGHGLGVAPKLVIVKARTGAATTWVVYHQNANASAATGYLALNDTIAFTTLANVWGNVAPTASVFSVSNNASSNANTINYVAYCFAEIPGYSKFDSYAGNGAADGPFVFCGFRPRYLMVKRVDAGAVNWQVIDTARDIGNQMVDILAPNSAAAELANYVSVDVNSNGFKVRNTDGSWNTSGGTYIFAAFAEAPFKYANAR